MDTAEVLGQEYRPRILDAALAFALRSAGAVVLAGARAAGKTMTALHAANSFAFIDDPDLQQLLEIAPSTVLNGDAVVTLPDGRWGAVEVTLGAGRAAEGLASLNATIAQIATESSGEPAFRMVVTGTGRALVVDDGAVIAPLSALSP